MISEIKSKLPSSGTTIFSIMSALAAQHNAINLSQGFPDFDAPEELISLVNHYMKKGANQYAPMPGIISLREKLSEKYFSLYNKLYNPDSEITITSGGTEAIYVAITSMIHPGDEAVIFEPAYDCYVPAIILSGGIPVYISLNAPDFSIDWNKVRNAVSNKTKLIIINTPHNPGGSVMTEGDMQQLISITSNTGIKIISDEVYEHIIFDGNIHQSVCRFPELAERSFAIYSFGKTYHTTGWKMGYCLAPSNLMNEFRKVHQFVVFSSFTPVQFALADYIQTKNYLSLGEFYQKKRDYFLMLIAGTTFTFKPAKGSYFQCLGYSNISNEPDRDFAVRMTKEFGIASIPVSAFYHSSKDDHLLRFCFAKKEETLERAAEKLHAVK